MDPTKRGEGYTERLDVEKFISPSWKKGTRDSQGNKLEGLEYIGRVISNFSDIMSAKLSRIVHKIKGGEWINNDKVREKLGQNLKYLSTEADKGNAVLTNLLTSFEKIKNKPPLVKSLEMGAYKDLDYKLHRLKSEAHETAKLFSSLKKSESKSQKDEKFTDLGKSYIKDTEEKLNSMLKNLKTLEKEIDLPGKKPWVHGTSPKSQDKRTQVNEMFNKARNFDIEENYEEALSSYKEVVDNKHSLPIMKAESYLRMGKILDQLHMKLQSEGRPNSDEDMKRLEKEITENFLGAAIYGKEEGEKELKRMKEARSKQAELLLNKFSEMNPEFLANLRKPKI